MAASTSTRSDHALFEWTLLEILPSFIYVIAAILGACFVYKLGKHSPRSANSQNQSSFFIHLRERMALIMLSAPYAAFSLSLIFATNPLNLDVGGSIENNLLWAGIIAIVIWAGMGVAEEHNKLQKQKDIINHGSFKKEEVAVLKKNHAIDISVWERIGLIIATVSLSWFLSQHQNFS